MTISAAAGKPADSSSLVNVPRLVAMYYARRPDPDDPAQRVVFGTSGHRGSSLEGAFNEWHILAISQSICEYRRLQRIDGPLFLGIDTHALSEPAFISAMEVLAANGIDVMLSAGTAYTPTPAVSHAIVRHNERRQTGLADGIVITPSHNPPDAGGFKYDPPHGGPADPQVTSWIETRSNALLRAQLAGVKRMPFDLALRATTTHTYDYLGTYVGDLDQVIDLAAIRDSRISIGVDPLGGAGIDYWPRIAERYGLKLSVVNDVIDPTFRFMTVDWDGRIRMDPSSPYAMQRLIGMKDRFDIAIAADTDHDRHGVVTKGSGLLSPNQYLSVCIQYLLTARTDWKPDLAIGKTIVSSSLIDRVTGRLGHPLYEVPVGFRWFVDGLLAGQLAFAGEESAGASFLCRDGHVWATDKDGIIPGLLAAEITARLGKDPGEVYRELVRDLGEPVYARVDNTATAAQRAALAGLSPGDIHVTELAGEPIQRALTAAPGNGAPIGGIKVIAEHGWFAVRPSGTEEIYKVYAESFRDHDHLRRIEEEAEGIVSETIDRSSSAAAGGASVERNRR